MITDDKTSRKILITGARSIIALDLCRHFAAANCKVYIADSMPVILGSISNAIEKFILIPSPANKQQFIDALLNIVKAYQIDVIVPVFEEAYYLAAHHSQYPITQCAIFCAPFDTLLNLHHKWYFQERLKKWGILNVPAQLITTEAELHQVDCSEPLILKACFSRAALECYKINSKKDIPKIKISPQYPWTAQTFLTGKKYCSYSVCHDGKLTAHAVYPVKIAIDDSSCLMFETIEHPKINEWVNHLVKLEKYTGQISFDFIETETGALYAIECNPRATSGVHLFDKKNNLAAAYLNEATHCITPMAGTRRQIFIGMLLYGWRKKTTKNILDYFKYLFTARDVVFDKDDLKPFFRQSIFFIYIIKLARKLKLSLPAVFHHDLEWNGD